MKQKRTSRKPPWQSVPFAEISKLIRAWERLKKLREDLKNNPGGVETLAKIGQDDQTLNEWLATGKTMVEPSSAEHIGAMAAHSILRLWETFTAVNALQNPMQMELWMKEKPAEERLLLSRLSRRIPISNHERPSRTPA